MGEQGKEGAVDAYGEGQDRDGRSGEAGAFPQAAGGEAEVRRSSSQGR